MPTLPAISPELVKKYQEEIGKTSSSATAKRKVASLNKFFGWAENQGYVDASPMPVQEKPQTDYLVTSPKTTGKVGMKTWAFLGTTFGLIILIFLLTWKVGSPIEFVKNFAADINSTPTAEVTVDNQNALADTTQEVAIPADSASNKSWNLYANLKLNGEDGTPQVGSQTIRFKVYNTESGGNPLYTSEPQTVTTDSEGSTLISLDNVPTNLFFENNQLFLEPEMSSSSANTRIPVSTANTAANLRGFTPADPSIGADSLTIPVIDKNGSLNLASQSPAINAKVGNLLVQGQAVTLKTVDGGNGNIEINPDGSGITHFLFEGSKGNFLNAQAPNLNSGSLYYGIVANNSTGYDLLRLQNGSNPITRFAVDALGNTTTTGNINAGGNIQTSGVTRITSGGNLQNITGYSQNSGNFTINQNPGDFASIAKTGTALNNAVTLTLDERGTNNTSYSTLVLNRYNAYGNGMALLVSNGNAQFDGQVKLGNFATNPSNIGTGSLVYNTTDNNVYFWNGSTWVAVGTASSVAFSDVLSGTNTTASMVVGSGASLTTTGTGIISATDLTCSGCVANSELANSAVTINTGGILSGGGSVSLGGSINLTATEADTLDSVTGRGATTANAITVGNITDSGLTASKAVFTDASKQLTSTGTLGVDQGGTGFNSYTTGDILYADSATTLAKLSDIATGNVLLSGGVGAAPSYGKVTLGTHTTGNYVSSLTGTANQIDTSASTGDITLSIPSDFRAPGTVNAVNGIYTGATAGTQRIDASGNLTNIGTTQLHGITYTWPGADGATGQVLSTNGSGTLSWTTALTDSSIFWTQNSANGVLYPKSGNVDVLIGSDSTASAKFAFTNTSSGIPTATIAGTTTNVATFLTGEGNLAVTNMDHLTLGGPTTGGIDLGSPITSGTWNGTEIGAVYGGTGQTSYTTGDLLYADSATTLAKLSDAATGNVLLSGGVGAAPSYGKVVLGTHTTGNYVSSLAGTANQITASASTGDITLSIPSDFRAPGTVNAVNGIYTGATAGTQRIDASGNLTNIGTTQLHGVTYTWPGSIPSNNYILQAQTDGTLAWVDPTGAVASTIYWNQANGVIYPKNNTVDFLIGSDSTASAKFAVTSIGSGVPTATIAGTASNVAAYLTGNGNLAVTNMADLTLGGATTGRVVASSPLVAGSITDTGLTASKGVFTDANKQLTSTGVLGTDQGGTGISSYTTGDLIYASGTNTLSTLADAATGNALISGGVGAAPSWGKIVLGTHTTGNYVATITGTANQITASASTGDITLSIPSDFRAPGTVNAVNGIYTGATAGTQRIDASGNLTNIGTTQFNNKTYTWPSAIGANNYVLQTQTDGTLAWVDPAAAVSSTIYWNQDETKGVLHTKNNTVDVLIGSNATTSAKFAFTGVNGGLPTATIAGTTANVATYLTGNGNLATTNMAHLTIGGATTGGIDLASPVTSGVWNGTEIGATYGGTGQTSYTTGDLLYADSATTLAKLSDVATGNVLLSGGVGAAPSYGKVVLGTHTTGNYVSSLAGTANQITASASTGDITLSIPSDFRAPGTVNATNGLYTGATAGTQRIDATGNLTNIGTTQLHGVTYTWPGTDAASSGYILSSNASGTLSWVDPAGAVASTIYWNQANGALYPKNSTVDMLVGGTATTSAKFAFTGVTSGTPTASIAGSTNNVATYITGDGNLATTNAQDLTIGGSTTGNVVINSRGSSTLTANGANLTASGTLTLPNSNTLTGISNYLQLSNGISVGGASTYYFDKNGNINAAEITGSGITDTGLTANKPVFTDGSKKLTSSGTVPADQGGTGFSSYTVGDLLYADSATTLAKLSDIAVGNVLLSGGVGAAPSYGKVVLGTHTTGNYVSSLAGTANQITASASTGDITLSIPSDFRAPGTVNAVTGIYTGATAGTQRIDASGNLTNIGTTQFNSKTYTWPSAIGANNYVLQTQTDGTLAWVDPNGAVASTIYWTQANGAVYPKNNTVDLLVGSESTASAKFSFTGVNSGIPTASISGTYITSTGNIANTNMEDITIGGATTGNVIANSPFTAGSITDTGLTASKGIFTDANKKLTSTGTLGVDQGGTGFTTYAVGDLLYADTTTTLAKLADVATGNVLISGGINTAPSWGKVTLGTHTTGNYVSSLAGTANQITASASTGDITLSIPSDFRAPGTVNAVNGIYTGATAGTQRIDASGNLTNIGTTQLHGITYTWPGADGSNGQVLTTSGTGTLSWQDVLTSSSVLWTSANGAIFPKNSSMDVLFGGSATTSAKFVFKGVNSGTPTASISGSTANVTTFIDGNGNISTTNRANLVLGNSTTYDTTGNILLNPNGTGRVGIGTASLDGGVLNVMGSVAIYGEETAGDGIGVLGYSSTSGIGVEGRSVEGIGVNGSGYYGVYGTDNVGTGYGVYGFSGSGYGIYGVNDSGSEGAGVLGTGNIGVQGSGSNYDFYTDNTIGKSYFAGQVGVGASNPTAKLEVQLSGTETNGIYLDGSTNPYTGTDSFSSLYVNQDFGNQSIAVSGDDYRGYFGADIEFPAYLRISQLEGSGVEKIATKNNNSGMIYLQDGSYDQGGSIGSYGTENSLFNTIFFQDTQDINVANFYGLKNTVYVNSILQVSNVTPVNVYGSHSTVNFGMGGSDYSSAIASIYGDYIYAKGSTTGNQNLYALYIDSGSGGADTNYSIYSGLDANSYFAGNIGIRTTTPTAVLDVAGAASVSGSLTFRTGAGSIQTTAGSPLTIGGSTTGNITLNPSNAIAGGYVAPNTTNVSDLGTASVSWRNIYGQTIYTGGTQRINSSGNLTNIGTTQLNGVTYTWPGSDAASSGYVLSSNASGTLSWVAQTGGSNYWGQGNGALYPLNNTVDLLIGSSATSSANFAFTGVNGGNSTASIAGSVANVRTFITGNGNIAVTNMAHLTLGGATTGAVDVSNDLNLASGKSYQINGTSVLNATTLGSNVVSSSLTSVGALASGSIANGFGTIATGNTITGTTLNGTTGINTGASAGTQRIDSSGNLKNIGTTQLNSVTYTWPGADAASSGYVLSSNAAGTLSWVAQTGGSSYWGQANGLLYPLNKSVDLAIGGSATTSAKFVFKGVNSGTPTASISGSTANVTTFIDGNGNISTTNRANLVLGNSATYNTTGDILLNPNGTGNVGIGTTTPTSQLYIKRDTTDSNGITIENPNASGYSALKFLSDNNDVSIINYGSTGSEPGVFKITSGGYGDIFVQNSEYVKISQPLRVTGTVGIGTLSPTAKFQVTDTDTTTGSIFYATASAITSGNIIKLGNGGNVNFTGNAIYADLDNTGGGSFTGNFIKFDNATSTKFTVDSLGNITGAGTTGLTLSGASAGIVFSGANAHAISVSTAATNLTIDAGTTGTVSIGASSTGDVLLAGGAAATGCTVTNSNGNLVCAGVAQVGGTSATTYSRFGTATTGHALSGADDVLMGGDLELNGVLYLDGRIIANPDGTSTIIFANNASAIDSPNILDNGVWWVNNNVNNGMAALMVNQQKGGDIFSASVSGTPKFTIKNDGDVGIGTTTPDAKLSIVGGTSEISSTPVTKSIIFEGSGTWTAPTGTTSVTVEAWGGGGGGGGSYSSLNGGGGGGGAFAKKVVAVTSGNNYTVTVGSGGAGSKPTTGVSSINAGNGGDSWFSTSATVLAKGGSGGTSNNNSGTYGIGGAGGSSGSSIGDTVYAGGNGANGVYSTTGGGGGGAAGTTETGYDGSNSNTSGGTGTVGGYGGKYGGGDGGDGTIGTNGGNGKGIGGGGGGVYYSSTTSYKGGDGASGKVKLTWTETPAINPSIITAFDNSSNTKLTLDGSGNLNVGTTDSETKLAVQTQSYSGPQEQKSQIFSATDTWTVPSGVTSVTVEAWGGGGNGGSTYVSTGQANGGGGGGAYARKEVSVTPGGDYTVTVGGAGGDSWFSTDSTVLAKGGSNGGTGSNGAGGAGGSSGSSIGDTVYAGGNGAAGQDGVTSGGGGGAAGSSGAGGNASAGTGGTGTSIGGGDGGNGVYNATFRTAGESGYPIGGGGAGTYWGNSGGLAGSSGASGLVKLTWTETPTSISESYTSNDIFTVPDGVTSITVKTWGAGGAGGAGAGIGTGGNGGGGGFAQSTISVTPGEELSIEVGSGGSRILGLSSGGNGGGYTAIKRSSTYLVQSGGGGGGGGANDSSTSRNGGNGGPGGGRYGINGGVGLGTATVGDYGRGGNPGSGGSGGAAGTGGTAGTAGDANVGGNGGAAGTGGNGGTGGGGSGSYVANLAGGGGGGGGTYGGGGGGSSDGAARSSGGGGGGGSTGDILTPGSGIYPGNYTDSDYNGTAGVGGVGGSSSTTSVSGTTGLLVIKYSPPVADLKDSSSNSVFKTLDNGSVIATNKLGVGTTAAPNRNLDVTGSWGGNTFVDVSEAVDETRVVTQAALVYDLTKNTGLTNTATTTTWNITGLPEIDGTFAFIYTTVSKGITGSSRVETLNVQINGSQVSTVATASTTAAATVKEMYTIVRSNGVWHLSGGTSAADTADIAEWYEYTGATPRPGQIVSIGEGPSTVETTTKENDPKVIGIVSTNPNITLGSKTDTSVQVALSGRIPVIVSTKGGEINVGDYITSSGYIAGVGMKANTTSSTVGKALENTSSWNVESCQTVSSYESIIWPDDDGTNQSHPCFVLPDETIVGKMMAYANISTYDPDINISNTNDITIDYASESASFIIKNVQDLITKVGAFSSIFAANIKAGIIETTDFIAENIKSGAMETTNFIADNIVSKIVKTNVISPLADSTDVVVKLGSEATPSGKLAIENIEGQEVASIDSDGNATFSGTLYADEIKSRSLEDIEALLADVQADQNILFAATQSADLTASGSANIAELITNNMFVTGQAMLSSASIADSLTLGSDMVIGLNGNTINSLSTPLQIQSLAMAPVEIMGGLVTIDTQGNMQISGNLYVAGRINSSGLTLKDNPETNVEEQNQLLSLEDSTGTQVAGVSSSGSANFNSIAASQFVIAAGEDATNSAIIDGVITTNATAGSATIPAGVSEITIKNNKVGDYTLVYVTPTSETRNNVLYVKSKQAGQFVVGFTNPIEVDTNFNWWIVQIQN